MLAESPSNAGAYNIIRSKPKSAGRSLNERQQGRGLWQGFLLIKKAVFEPPVFGAIRLNQQPQTLLIGPPIVFELSFSLTNLHICQRHLVLPNQNWTEIAPNVAPDSTICQQTSMDGNGWFRHKKPRKTGVLCTSLDFYGYWNGAQGRTWTGTAYATTPSR